MTKTSPCLKIVSLDSVEVVHTTFYYDIPWEGLCLYDGSLFRFESVDLTDYQIMEMRCSYCSGSGVDPNTCSCYSYTRVVCNLFKPSLVESAAFKISKTLLRLRKLFEGQLKLPKMR